MISSPLDLIICENSSQNSGKHLYFPVYDIIKDNVKDVDEQPDEEIIGRGLGGSPGQELLSYEVRWLCPPTQKLSESSTTGLFMKPSSHRHHQ